MSEARILLVEDDPMDVKLTRRALTKAGLQVSLEVVEDGEQAVDYLLGPADKRGPLPALVLLDLKLPKITGHQVLERIRADPRTRRLPVIVLTSSLEEADLARCYDLGANSYVRKPVEFDAFVEAARQVGAYWLVLNQPPPLVNRP
ncbi:MAG TPA: response regulator [Polyangia bacterium]|nr:response regulator [Polyangia bacterium]